MRISSFEQIVTRKWISQIQRNNFIPGYTLRFQRALESSVFVASKTNYFSTGSAFAVSRLKAQLSNQLSNQVSDQFVAKPPVSNEFSSLGLLPDIVEALRAQDINVPTPVQRAVIPRLLARENIVMAASTGSGKTLAYALPAVQCLADQELRWEQQHSKSSELSKEPLRRAKRPRCLILVPTRELARQVLQSIKLVGHYSKVSSTAVLGGEQYTIQKKNLDRLVDIVVASPGRLMQHKEKGNVFFSQVNQVIIDEVDTMLTQGFGSDIRAVLRSVLAANKRASLKSADAEAGEAPELEVAREDVQLVMATATLTKAVRALLDDVSAARAGGGKRSEGFNIEFSDPSNKTPRKFDGTEDRVKMKIVEVDGLHRSLPNVRHTVEETKGQDKLSLLMGVLSRSSTASQKLRTLIFCNTIDSCRAVEYAINDETNGGKFHALSYHGDLNSRDREANLEKFRSGEELYLVCTDIAARGLDIPEIGHVVMFDFPLNPIDYLHRAGRCGRAGRKGLVTSLITKRDKVLSDAIQAAIARGLPLDSLSSSKRDYLGSGKLASVVGNKATKPRAAAGAGRLRTPRPLGRRSGRSPASPDERTAQVDSKRQSAPRVKEALTDASINKGRRGQVSKAATRVFPSSSSKESSEVTAARVRRGDGGRSKDDEKKKGRYPYPSPTKTKRQGGFSAAFAKKRG